MYTNDRNAYRQAFFQTWLKYQNKETLEPLEKTLIDVILLHPEYHHLLNHPNSFQEISFELEENPFLHMSLHMSVNEQIKMDRPVGIKKIYTQLQEKLLDEHEVMHQMMKCLAQVLWEAQQNASVPDEKKYLELLTGI